MIKENPPCEDNTNDGSSTDEWIPPKLIQEIEVEDKFGQEVLFQLWNNPATTGIFEGPETWSLTCRINGEDGAWQHWNNYDAAIFDNLDDAVSSLQGHVKLVGGSENE